ncbi:RagB/SusD family nutrient uptake outer membrane protein [Sphingobacterium oryzagri]|uniref:RagB/SusD family nutrient uptake outer membrane protein n=1 Tax=Sphingobacterium oryzagri TaxID=3025669 RepID=A0ABY7WGS5_9SPHI|nr:RagB/SusD family nutrient uptake outer membrane protein [Sphingobacterium sp. KACC 22765]WDF68826.1 RagB/SusD family nutrient uptake outer membrane protein [Sphingobacterium sp. KACC 22765]
MTHKINKLWAIILIATGLSSCSDYLDTVPTTSVPESVVIDNVDNLQTLLNGAWRTYMDTYYTFANPGYAAILRASDAMGSDVAVVRGRYGFLSPYDYLEMHTRVGTRVNAFWTILYTAINTNNIILANVDNIPGDDLLRQQLKGQALAFRAHSYLTIASFYQLNYATHANTKTAPIYTEPTGPQTVGNPKASLKEIFDLVIQDLTSAEQLLADYQRPTSQKYKINKQVVQALLARAYLQTNNWEAAAQKAAEARSGYALMTGEEYAAGFNDLTNSEWIWGHGQRTDQSTASYNFHYLDVSTPASYYYSFMADPHFKDFFEEGDVRYSLFSWDNSAPARYGLLRYAKFRFREDMTGDIVLIRSAETYLIQAEAYARLNRLTESATVLNQLRTARNASPLSAAGKTQTEVVAEILLERRKELWGEGFALSDIIRTQGRVERKAYTATNSQGQTVPAQVSITLPNGNTQLVNVIGHTTLRTENNAGSEFTANSPYYIFGIPENESNNNPNLNN